MARRVVDAVRSRARCEEGHALIESAVAFPVLLMVAIGLVQFALFTHAQNVVNGAVQDGARVAAAEGRTLPEGVGRAEALLQAGIGAGASEFAVSGIDAGDAVVIEARGRLRAIIPWVADAMLPLGGESAVLKEGFRAGPAH